MSYPVISLFMEIFPVSPVTLSMLLISFILLSVLFLLSPLKIEKSLAMTIVLGLFIVLVVPPILSTLIVYIILILIRR